MLSIRREPFFDCDRIVHTKEPTSLTFRIISSQPLEGIYLGTSSIIGGDACPQACELFPEKQRENLPGKKFPDEAISEV